MLFKFAEWDSGKVRRDGAYAIDSAWVFPFIVWCLAKIACNHVISKGETRQLFMNRERHKVVEGEGYGNHFAKHGVLCKILAL
jgi:hypothetical protein